MLNDTQIRKAFQHTAARRRLGLLLVHNHFSSTCFNTQPPEGGWAAMIISRIERVLFQHTAARRRLGLVLQHRRPNERVSTHSRPKAAGKV